MNAPPLPRPSGRARRLAFTALQVAIADTVVAAVIHLLHRNPFWMELVYAQGVGLSSFALIVLGQRVFLSDDPGALTRTGRGYAIVVVACLGGYFLGTLTGNLLEGDSMWGAFARHPEWFAYDFLVCSLFSTLVVGWFFLRARNREQRERAAAALHEATLARLALLQSQLEPHMLFNTLANLRALIGADPVRAQAMLDHLIDFLRATLAASRAGMHPLADEFARIEDYLALMRVRMGERLRTTLALPAALGGLPVPALLLQALVENAIKHGLEPQRGPGDLAVSARAEGATLVLRVVDSGRGLVAAAAQPREAPGAGFGLAQLRERLQALYGDAAAFSLAPAPGGGTLAELRLPLAAAPAATGAPPGPASSSCAMNRAPQARP